MGTGRTTFTVDGGDQVIEHSANYFNFESSNTDVAIINEAGRVEVVGEGFSSISAKLGDVDAQGGILLAATAPPPTAAPTPTRPPSDVISLFSNAYTNNPVDTFSAEWDQADVTDVKVESSDVKAYTNIIFAGIEFVSQPVDATDMTHLHLDVWGEETMVVRVKLVDFGPDGMFGGGDDSEWELTFNASTIPSYMPGQWSPTRDPPGQLHARWALERRTDDHLERWTERPDHLRRQHLLLQRGCAVIPAPRPIYPLLHS